MATRALPLLHQNVWIVGGVGVVGRGIARSLLRAGATVIVNSRSPERMRRFEADIEEGGAGDDAVDPGRLLTVRGSLLPGHAAKTVSDTLRALPLHHVVAHGALRLGSSVYADETHSLSTAGPGGLLGLDPEEFVRASSQLSALHFSAAAELVPRVQFAASGIRGVGTYTLVTGRGGVPAGPGDAPARVPAVADLNQYQVWGLASALRHQGLEKINVRELRVRLDVSREEPGVPLPTRIGDLCAGMAAHPQEDMHQLFEVSDLGALNSLSSGKYGNAEEDLDIINA